MQHVREAAFILSCSILVRTVGGVLIFAALNGVWYPADHITVTVGSVFAILGSLLAAVVGAVVADMILVGGFVAPPMLRRVSGLASLKGLGMVRIREELTRLSKIGLEFRKGVKFRFDRVGFVLGCVDSLYISEISGITVAMLCVALQLHFINQRLKVTA